MAYLESTDPALQKSVIEFPHEHDPLRFSRLFPQFFVGLMITADLVPVLKLVRKAPGTVDQTAVLRARRIEFIGQSALSASAVNRQSKLLR